MKSRSEMARLALVALASMLLLAAVSRADDGAPVGAAADAGIPAQSAPEAADTPPAIRPDPAIARHHQPATHRTVAQGIDESVQRLSRGLDLDPQQQQRLRQILVDQHRQILALRSGSMAVAGDAAGTSLAIYDQTKARIRAMLNDEQRKKYSAEVSRAELAPAQADLQHWMGLQEAQRRKDQDEGQTK